MLENQIIKQTLEQQQLMKNLKADNMNQAQQQRSGRDPAVKINIVNVHNEYNIQNNIYINA